MKKIKSRINWSIIQRRLIREVSVTFLIFMISISGVLSAPVTEDDPQQFTVRGTVTDSNTGEALAGVNVVVQGTTIGAMTGAKGDYTIVAPNPNSTLVFSFIGYTPQEIAIGNRATINVRLSEELQALSEVVVTALGIRREAKSLGYSTASVDTKQILEARTINVGNSLQGKISGLNISAPPTGPGGSSKIRIRGQSSFGGNNAPLIVVNGVPINNSTSTSSGSADLGDGLASINSDDIETMTVLKGATAAALYGYRAKDGVIIITTKSGAGQRGIGVEVTSNFQADIAIDYTDFQYEYGQGEYGKRPASVAEAQSTGVWSFGEKFDGAQTWMSDGKQHPYVPYKDIVKKFYEPAITLTNSVAVSGGDEKGTFRVGYSNTDANAIIPGSTFTKNIIDVGINYNLTEKLTVQLNANYSLENRVNPPVVGGQDFNINNTIFTLANSIDLEYLKDPYKDEDGNEQPLARFRNRTNPYWTMNERFENYDRNRLFGNLLVKYQLFDWLFIQGRLGQDQFNVLRDYNTPTGTAFLGAAAEGFNGSYYQQSSNFMENNFDFMIGANKEFGDFNFDLTFGGNRMDNTSENLSASVSNFYVRDLYSVGNGITKNPGYGFSHKRVNSLYGTLNISFRDFIFVNGTARNDWFSTLNPASNSYLYPSVSTSFLFTEALKSIMPAWLNFGKIRLAYAEVGGDTSPYAGALNYGIASNPFNGFAMGGISTGTSPNAFLQPLKVKEVEVGLELMMFNRRITLDMAVYNKNTVDEILNVDISAASGYGSTKVNLGRLNNRGIEMLLTLVPVSTVNLTWNTSFNYTHSSSEVLELAGGQDRINVGSGNFFGNSAHEVGLPLSSLRGYDYKRDDQGRILTVNGRFQKGNEITFGSAAPTDIFGWLNTFTYKGWRLFAQVDYKGGMKMFSETNFNMTRHGLTQMTLEGRETGVVFDGYNADGSPNTTAVEVETFWADYRGTRVVGPFVYDASFIKLRTITLGSDLSRYVSGTFIRGLNVNAYINNVWLIKSHVPNVDPESNYSTSDNKNGFESSAMPTTRSYGLNLNFRF